MSNEYGNVVPHDFHVGPEVFVIFTLEIQLNPWERCRMVVCSSEEMKEANLESSGSRTGAERHMLGLMEGTGVHMRKGLTREARQLPNFGQCPAPIPLC